MYLCNLAKSKKKTFLQTDCIDGSTCDILSKQADIVEFWHLMPFLFAIGWSVGILMCSEDL